MARVTLVLVGAAGAAAVAASVLVPRVRAVPGPDPISVVVPVVLIGCALLLAQRGRRWTATLLGGSAMVWCAVGVASAVPGPLADDLLRLGVLPLALVVVAVVALPGGTPTATRAATVVALGVAVSGGAGATTHIRLLLGALLIVVAAHRVVVAGFAAIAHSRLAGMAVLLQSAFGVALGLLDPSLGIDRRSGRGRRLGRCRHGRSSVRCAANPRSRPARTGNDATGPHIGRPSRRRVVAR